MHFRPGRSRESRALHRLVALWLQLALPASALALTPIDAHFDSDSEGFAYLDDAFRATSQPSYASGSHSASGGFSGGGLTLQLAGVDDADIDDMSGAWAIDFSLGEAAELELSFRYELTQSPDYESSEYSQVMVSLDGTPLAGAGADYVVEIRGNGNGGSPISTGWELFSVDLGTLSAGSHTIRIGGYNNRKTLANEETALALDDVLLAPPAPPDLTTQSLVDALDLTRFKSNIQKLSSSDPFPPAGDPEINGSRYWTRNGNLEAVEWLRSELESYGYDNVVLHPYLKSGQVRHNVYATKIGVSRPNEMYIVSAHLDSETVDGSGQDYAAGADDDASGCSAVLEIARVFGAPTVQTDYSIRFVFWNNEETGLEGSAHYANDFYFDQGVENPPGSGQYPEPEWRGVIQHDMILYDHGPFGGSQQSPNADIDIEYQWESAYAAGSVALANALLAANVEFAADYPAQVSNDMSHTDSATFEDYAPAISLRENRRVAEIGYGSNPHYHAASDVYEGYSELDFLFGFNVVQTTTAGVAALAGAVASVCGNGVLETGEGCDDGGVSDGDCCSAECVFEDPGGACEDGDACTALDTCDGAGACLAGGPLDCDDGLYCTGVETCDAIAGCQPGTPPLIDDGVACTDDSCDELADAVVNSVNHGSCDNLAFCDGVEICDPVADCQPGAPIAFDDGVACTDDSCDELADMVVHAINHGNCDNLAFCDGVEICDPVADCQPGAPIAFDDGVACTNDSCDEVADAVVNAAVDANCDDGDPCTADGCDAQLGCSHAPIVECQTAAVPTASGWGYVALALLMMASSVPPLRRRGRRSVSRDA